VDRERGTEVGAGISVGKEGACFVVAPAHVVDDPEGSDPVRSIRVTDEEGRRAKATVIKAIVEFDAADRRKQRSFELREPRVMTNPRGNSA
jgi:hypothetical protein